MSEKVEPKDGEWTTATPAGPNEQLFKLFTKMAELTRLTVEQKIAAMKLHVNAEAHRLNHPAVQTFADEINKIKVD